MKTQTSEPMRALAGASDEPSALTPQAVQQMRALASSMNTQIASLIDTLAEPLKSRFLEIKGEVNTMLASLAPTDQAPAALESNSILRQLIFTLQSAQSMIAELGAAASGKAKELARVTASMPEEITKAIDAQVNGGTLFTKDGATKLAQDAVAAARTEWTKSLKAISDRRTALASASFPVPANDEILAGEDAEYAARKTKAEGRAEKLKAFASLSAARVAELAWGASDESFNSTLEALREATAPAKSGGKPNPLAAGTPGAAPAGRKYAF